jgi:hypothetical protein
MVRLNVEPTSVLESLPFIVHNSFSTQTSNVLQIGGAGGRDYMKTSLLGQLCGVRANVARGPMDEYGLPRGYVGIIEEHLPSRDGYNWLKESFQPGTLSWFASGEAFRHGC